MSALTFNAFLSEALCLPVEQRSRLATVLIDSLDADDDAKLTPAWKEEVVRRASELNDGSVLPLSLEEFRSRIETQLA